MGEPNVTIGYASIEGLKNVNATAGKEFTIKALLKSNYGSELSYKVVFKFNNESKEVTGLFYPYGYSTAQSTFNAPCVNKEYPITADLYVYDGSGNWLIVSSAGAIVNVTGKCEPAPKPRVPGIFNYINITTRIGTNNVKLDIKPKNGFFNYAVEAFGVNTRFIRFLVSPDWSSTHTTPAYYVGEGFNTTVNLPMPRTSGEHIIKITAQVSSGSGAWSKAGLTSYSLSIPGSSNESSNNSQSNTSSTSNNSTGNVKTKTNNSIFKYFIGFMVVVLSMIGLHKYGG